MTEPAAVVHDEVVSPLPDVPAAERDRLARAFGDAAVHAHALQHLGALRAVEVRGAEAPATAVERLRVVAWNVERGRHPEAVAEVIAGTGAQVALLTELDVGMARSGQRHTPSVIADALGHGYAFGVEFVELGLGGRDEREELAGQRNERGLHGAAVLSALELRRPILVRFDTGGAWFTEAWRAEPRVGGRMAVVATVPWGTEELVVVSVHLESHGDPDGRAAQMASLLTAVDGYAGDRPVVVGGDLNTFSAAALEMYSSALRRGLAVEAPDRFVDPVSHEPLFGVAARHGYRWQDANVRATTQRTGPSGSPKPPLMHLDWILVRGVEVEAPAIVPAVGPAGTVLSDHDAVAVTIRSGGRP
ncbi:MAG TPA: endonuclease/exonuclease/phosphatase family protein [Acidimicrobiales bacterium]|nr:endonuclease/exonuclease/phosphatase family protein [Acidimicrobiales bacterium]